eukprot:CAMPEP_0178453592 /NCGR_PEP_ID=MMETSP0689_2-20121128/44895_1 /TAXON_ID=160604 /ORGANISM="Amphidinium massartii, Strain CS-259" /LENGTH=377 /DNA_ID=CAMNT_0020079445 /DNA_START=82 /DNA_END=1215 /DNA_ORIENTATION=-
MCHWFQACVIAGFLCCHAGALRPKDFSEDGLLDIAQSHADAAAQTHDKEAAQDVDKTKCYKALYKYVLKGYLEDQVLDDAIRAMHLFAHSFVLPANTEVSTRNDKEMVFALAVQAIADELGDLKAELARAIERKGGSATPDDGLAEDWIDYDGMGSVVVQNLGTAFTTATNSRLKGGIGSIALATWLLTLLKDDFAKWIDETGGPDDTPGAFYTPAVMAIANPGGGHGEIEPLGPLDMFLKHKGFKTSKEETNLKTNVVALWVNAYNTLVNIPEAMTGILRQEAPFFGVKRGTVQTLWRLCQGLNSDRTDKFPSVQAMARGFAWVKFKTLRGYAQADESEVLALTHRSEDDSDEVTEKPKLKDYVAWLSQAPFIEDV